MTKQDIIRHQIIFRKEDVDLSILKELGYEFYSDKIGRIFIYEDDPKWPSIQKIIPKLKCSHLSGLPFSKKDIECSQFFYLRTSETGYPKPEDDYLQITFDDRNGCPGGDLSRFKPVIRGCGQGYLQKAPFRLNKPSGMKSKQVFGIHWQFDVVFARIDIYEAVFAPLGVGSLPVIHHKSGNYFSDFVQLKIEEEIDFHVDDLPYQIECEYCGKVKYMYNLVGLRPAPTQTNSHIFRSKQEFGSGFMSYKLVYISKELYNLMKHHRIHNCAFDPCKNPY